MRDMRIDADDPRLTAYVLGECDPAERAEIERLVEHSPEAKAAVAEIRETAILLAGALGVSGVPVPDEFSAKPAAAPVAARPTLVSKPVFADSKKPRSWAAPAVVSLATTAAVAVAVAVSVGERPEKNTIAAFGRHHGRNTSVADDFAALGLLKDSDGNVGPMSLAWGSPTLNFGDEGWQHRWAAPNVINPGDGRLGGYGYFQNSGGGPTFFDPSPNLNLPNLDQEWKETGKIVGLAQPDQFTDNLDVQFGGSVPPPFGVAPEQQSVGATLSRFGTTTLSTAPPEAKMAGAGGEPALVAKLAEGGRPYIVADQSGSMRTTPAGTALRYDGTWLFAETARERAMGIAWGRRPYHGKSLKDITDVTAGVRPQIAERREGESYYYALTPRIMVEQEVGGEGDNSESYAPIIENRFVSPKDEPLSTFGIDVDTAAYANMRRFLAHGQMPPRDAVRIEELINYFSYENAAAEAAPADDPNQPLAVRLEAASCPWEPAHRLVRIALAGREIPHEHRPSTNLVFLLDVSGSMRDENKLPLVKQAMEMLVGEMTEDDRIAIVTYAGSAGLVLDSTSGHEKAKILTAINQLEANGSTNGESGIKLAYTKAVEGFLKEGSNRIVLCTDGDFNVGVSEDSELVTLIREKAKSGVFLSIFGFGMGNIKDAKLEQLADQGNGHYAYVDTPREAKKTFVEELTGTLYTVAKDVKLQVEFNPAKVGAYRLIGYENRALAAQDFDNDAKDAGDVGAGHHVTALYQVIPADRMTDEVRSKLKYQQPASQKPADAPSAASEELLTVSLRYKEPTASESVKKEYPLVDKVDGSTGPSRDIQWASAVAGFGLLLRNSEFRGNNTFDRVKELAEAAKGPDETGYRAEFIELVAKAKQIAGK